MIIRNPDLQLEQNLDANKLAKNGLYFLHIPKTAGTSLRYWLHDLFAEADWLPCDVLEQVRAMNRSEIQKYRFVSGHFGFKIMEYLDREPPVITWLRDPVERTISNYRYILDNYNELAQIALDNKQPDWITSYDTYRDLTLANLVNDERYVGFSDNLQTRHLSGALGSTNPIFLDREKVNLAKSNLERLFFVGICEWMDASTDALCYDLRVPHRRMKLNFNRASDRPSQSQLSFSDAELAQIEESEKYDRELYDFGCRLLEQRVKNFWQVIQPENRNESLSSITERLNESDTQEKIKAIINTRFQESEPESSRPLSGKLNFSDRVYQTGWHSRFLCELGCTIRWAGPKQSCTVFFPFKPNHDYLVDFTIKYLAEDQLIYGLGVVVDGQEVPVRFKQVSRPGERPLQYRVQFRVPAEVIWSRLHHTEVTFTVSGPLVDLGMGDNSRGSFATDEFRFRSIGTDEMLDN